MERGDGEGLLVWTKQTRGTLTYQVDQLSGTPHIPLTNLEGRRYIPRHQILEA